MADYKPLTQLRGPAARITGVSAETVPADQPADVTMTGPDQNRKFHFKVPRGLPGVNAVENDAALATYIASVDTQTRAALAAVFARRTAVDVRDFGAVGDGVTDDTAAIKAAIADVTARGGGEVLLPIGTFVVSSEVLIGSRIALRGRGRGTVVKATSLAPGDAAIRVGGATEANGVILEGFNLQGNPVHDADGLYLGNRTGSVAVSDLTVRDVRVSDFRVGIPARFMWDAVFSNVRVHNTERPLEWGPQVNSVLFSGAFSGLSSGALFSVCETIQFDRLDLVNFTGTGWALSLFQSNVTVNTPYFENLANLAQVGGASEASKSSLTIRGGRVTGDIRLAAPGVGLDVTMPWVVARGVAGDTRRLTVSNPSLLGAATRRIRVDVDQDSDVGVKVITRWRGDTAFPYASAYGGAGITSTAKSGYYELSSPTEGQGFLVSSALEVGKQYVLSYRIRKGSGGVYIRAGGLATATLPVVRDAALDFETLHMPFIATETSLRVLFGGLADVQYVSLVEGLRFLTN